MIEILPKLLLQLAGALLDRHPPVCNFQEADRSEVTDDAIDVRVKREAVEERDVQRECLVGTPMSDDLGVDREEEYRCGEAV
ncbi:MAG TPA: hypothetical protein VHV31_06275 [Nitrolancea sp.]|nr:hypothetical protein [Nitrolancea sp.]